MSVLMTGCSSLEDAPGYKLPEVAAFASNTALHDEYNRIDTKTYPEEEKNTQYRPPQTGTLKPTTIAPQTTLTPVLSRANNNNKVKNDVELVLGKKPTYQAIPVQPKLATSKGKGIALSFERANIREVVKVILGDILKLNYTVEPGVDGEVTINTSKPIAKESLLATLESLLQVQGAVLYKDPQGTYRIAPRSSMRGRGFAPNTAKKLPAGYGIKIVPLRFIPAAEMRKILEPLANPDAFVRVDSNRNLLV